MALRWYTVVIDCRDPQAQAHWWAETLDYQVVNDTADEAVAIPKGMSEDAVTDLDEWMGLVDSINVGQRGRVRCALNLLCQQ